MKVRVNNIGGITSELDLDLDKGVFLYKAPNAYGKTSFARALVSLLTSQIKPDDLLNVFADSGYVEVELDSKAYYRKIRRIKNNIVEDKKLIMDDDRALLLSFFSPENRLVSHIISGNDDLEWFISAASRIEDIKRRKDELSKKLEDLKVSRDEIQKKYKSTLDLQTQIKSIDEEIEKLEKEKESTSIISKTDTTLMITKQNKLNELKSKIELKTEELEETKRKLAAVGKAIKDMQEKLGNINKEKLEQELNEITIKLQEKTKERNEIEIELKALDRVLEEVREADLHHADTCYVCGSKVSPDIWKVRMDIISSEIRNNSAKISTINAEIGQLQKRKAEIETMLKELSRVENELNKLKVKKQDYENRIDFLRYQIDDLERQKREMEERYDKSSVVITSEGNNILEQRIEELKKRREDLFYELQSLGMPSSLIEELELKEKEIKDLEREVQDLEREYIRRLTVVKEEFIGMANSLLRELGFEIEAELDNNYRLIVKRNGAELSVKKLSSSERITLALILILIALREYFKSPFFIVDESFMSFDQTRFNKILNYLQNITDYVIVTRSEDVIEISRVSTAPQASS